MDREQVDQYSRFQCWIWRRPALQNSAAEQTGNKKPIISVLDKVSLKFHQFSIRKLPDANKLGRLRWYTYFMEFTAALGFYVQNWSKDRILAFYTIYDRTATPMFRRKILSTYSVWRNKFLTSSTSTLTRYFSAFAPPFHFMSKLRTLAQDMFHLLF